MHWTELADNFHKDYFDTADQYIDFREKKSNGIYYTPISLVNCLLDSVLDPIIKNNCNSESELLSITIVDPACGTGNMLVPAINRLANKLAKIRFGDNIPIPSNWNKIIVDIVTNCIYGVDIRQESVDLCKINLFLLADRNIEVVHALDKRIKLGNSLIGVGPEQKNTNLTKDKCDLWTARFFWPKEKEHIVNPIKDMYDSVNLSMHKAATQVSTALSEQFNFFHWPIQFPEVFARGGFDVVLSNPPWERIKLQEKEWFDARHPAIARAPNAAARKRMIDDLQRDDPSLLEAFEADRRASECASHFIRKSTRFPLCGRGDVNTYSVFAEMARDLIRPQGRAGVIVPSGIATDDTTKHYFQAIMTDRSLVSLYDFENRRKLFAAVDSRMKFCLLTLTGDAAPASVAEFVYFAHAVEDLADPDRRFTLSAAEISLLNPNTLTCPIFRTRRDAELTKAIYRRVPVLVRKGPPEVNPWGIKFATMFHMSNDSHLFRTRAQLEGAGYRLEGNRFVQADEVYLPLYEAKMFHHYDHRWATYDEDKTRDVTYAEKQDPHAVVLPRYWVTQREVTAKLADESRPTWFLVYRSIARATNVRTLLSTVIPLSAVSGKAPIIEFTDNRSENLMLVACLNSFAFDFAARSSVGGTDLGFFLVKQLPVLGPEVYGEACRWSRGETVGQWLLPRVLELTYTAHDLAGFARDCGYDGPPFAWDEERRAQLRAEIDAAYFHLYGIDRADVEYILSTFPIVQRKDEAQFGEYRTARLILQAYDNFNLV